MTAEERARRTASWLRRVPHLDEVADELDALSADLTASRQRETQAVARALWLAALDLVPIENRVEWVATLRARYDEVTGEQT